MGTRWKLGRMSHDSSSPPASDGSLWAALTSWRVASVVVLSVASGLPFGIVAKAIPAWLTYAGFDVATIGWLSLTRAPWSFKFLWAPLMDRFSFPFLGRKRSWMLVAQIGLIFSIALLALQGANPTVAWAVGLALAIAFFSATQDVAIDGYAVEILERHEQGVAVGARTALWRGAFFVSAGLGITLSSAGWLGSWPPVWLGLAAFFVPMAFVVVLAPEPRLTTAPPLSLREAVFDPLVAIFRTRYAITIMAFVVLYKLGDNLATALTTPFLIHMQFSKVDVGVATATIGLFATLGGTFLGGALTGRLGLGHSLWIFGVLQALSNLGYVAVEKIPTRPVMYSAIGFDNLCQGVGTGAFGVLLLRLTQKRFSATQYALLSSLFAIGGIIAGPPAGILVETIGWSPFFVFSVFAAIPGLVMLHRFAPLGVREPTISLELGTSVGNPITRGALFLYAALGTIAGVALGIAINALLTALRVAAKQDDIGFDYLHALEALVTPSTPGEWVNLAGPIAFGLVIGLGAAALLAARRGVTPRT